MKNLGFSRSLEIALCKGTAQNLDNFLQRKTECSAKCEGLKFVTHTAEVTVKCSAPSASTSSVADGRVKDALAECWRPAPCHGASELGVFSGYRAFLWLGKALHPEMSNAISYPRESSEKKPEGLRGRCRWTTKMEMRQWQMMTYQFKGIFQKTRYLSKRSCAFSVMCDRACMFFSLT